MFACIHGRSVSKSAADSGAMVLTLVELAFTFSPLVEQTSGDTIVLDVEGQDLLFGEMAVTPNDESNVMSNIANAIVQRANHLHLTVNVAMAANADAAIHAARSFKGVTIIDAGDELLHLGTLSIRSLDYSLAAVEEKRVGEFHETFALWGVRTFGDLAKLPLPGVTERLGQEGVCLQKLAQGNSDRRLNLVRPPVGFEQSLELEHPVTELEPLSFILSRLLNQLCANLNEYAVATNELRLRLITEPVRTPLAGNRTQPAGGVRTECAHERTITLPVPMRDSKTLLRLLLFDIEAHPPVAPIIKVAIRAEPVKPRASQTGLFIPLAPEPEKLEITLARLAKLVGPENVGSPELLDTHRPDAFRVKRFTIVSANRKRISDRKSEIGNRKCLLGFRIFRPPWHADVQTMRGQPTRISTRADSSRRVSGKIVCASGPWHASGDWWRADVWARDEWDVAVVDPTSQEQEVLCRIYRDLSSEQWFVAGIYD
jgi:protein ImuB